MFFVAPSDKSKMNVKLKAANLKVCMLIFVLQFFLNNIKAQAASCDRKISYPCKGSVKCIPNSYHCNGIVDCPNKDDENNCGKIYIKSNSTSV